MAKCGCRLEACVIATAMADIQRDPKTQVRGHSRRYQILIPAKLSHHTMGEFARATIKGIQQYESTEMVSYPIIQQVICKSGVYMPSVTVTYLKGTEGPSDTTKIIDERDLIRSAPQPYAKLVILVCGDIQPPSTYFIIQCHLSL